MVSEIEDLNHVVVFTIKHMEEDFVLEIFIKDGRMRIAQNENTKDKELKRFGEVWLDCLYENYTRPTE